MYGSEIPLACVGVISKVNMVFMAIAIGISQGCQPIWGFNYGAHNYDRVREAYKKAFAICIVLGVVFFGCFQLFPRQIVSIFGSGSEAYFHFAERYFRIFMFVTFMNGIQPMSSGFFTSIGKSKLGIVVSLTRQIIAAIDSDFSVIHGNRWSNVCGTDCGRRSSSCSNYICRTRNEGFTAG